MYRIMLWVLALAFLIALFSCAAGSNDGMADSTRAAASGRPSAADTSRRFSLLLAGVQAHDSIAVVNDFYVDQALRAALDSVPRARYLTLNYRDSLANLQVAQGKQGIALDDLAARLGLDGVIYTKVARFGSVLALDLRIIDPKSKGILYRDIAFSMIRYRDTSGTMYLGPTLYDAVRKSVGRYFGMPHTAAAPIATVPMIVSGVVIPKDPALGRLSTNRQDISTEGVKALGEYARLHFPELIAFDYGSRDRLYRLINVAAVDDYAPMNALERKALYGVGIDRYATVSVSADDSLRVRLELRGVSSASADSLIDSEMRSYPKTQFQTANAEDEFVVALIDLAEPLYKREAERIRRRYEATLASGK